MSGTYSPYSDFFLEKIECEQPRQDTKFLSRLNSQIAAPALVIGIPTNCHRNCEGFLFSQTFHSDWDMGRTQIFRGFGSNKYWKTGTAIEVFKFSLYLSIPVLASMVYNDPRVMEKMIRR